MQEKVIFREDQKFRQPWLWIGLFSFFLLQVYGLIQQVIFDKPFGNNPASDTTFIIIFIIYIGFMIFFNMITLTVEIRDDIFIRFYPIQRSFHKILVKDIKKYYVRTYSPIIDYGG